MKTISVPSKLSMNKDSRVIFKPKIRIIHVFEPKIIQADVANFREMVQKFTGKPAAHKNKTTVSQIVVDGNNSPSLQNGGEMKERKELYESKSPNDIFCGFAEIDGFFEDQVTEFSAFPFKSSKFYAEMPLH